MPVLRQMPPIVVPTEELQNFGQLWLQQNNLTKKDQSLLGKVFDRAVGISLAEMLGGLPISTPSSTTLLPHPDDSVEVGTVRIVGGIRPQNFDVGYRPDGVRFAYDT